MFFVIQAIQTWVRVSMPVQDISQVVSSPAVPIIGLAHVEHLFVRVSTPDLIEDVSAVTLGMVFWFIVAQCISNRLSLVMAATVGVTLAAVVSNYGEAQLRDSVTDFLLIGPYQSVTNLSDLCIQFSCYAIAPLVLVQPFAATIGWLWQSVRRTDAASVEIGSLTPSA